MAIVTLAIFGWLVERRHGPAVVLALFFGAGAAGALVADAAYPVPLANGANGSALALLAAGRRRTSARRALGTTTRATCSARARWRRCCSRCRSRAVPEASWLAGVVGATVGLLAGLGLSRMSEAAE